MMSVIKLPANHAPPSTTNVVPVTQRAALTLMYSAAYAMSSLLPTNYAQRGVSARTKQSTPPRTRSGIDSTMRFSISGGTRRR